MSALYEELMTRAKANPAIAAAVQRAGVDLIIAEAIHDRVGAQQMDIYLGDAASAKAEIKAHKTGWSRISTNQLIALGFVAELFLEDAERARDAQPPKPRKEAL